MECLKREYISMWYSHIVFYTKNSEQNLITFY